MATQTAYANGELDRETVLSRVIDAPRERVFRAWIEPEHMFQWFGPRGFRCEVHEVSEAKVGAVELGYQTLAKLDEFVRGQ